MNRTALSQPSVDISETRRMVNNSQECDVGRSYSFTETSSVGGSINDNSRSLSRDSSFSSYSTTSTTGSSGCEYFDSPLSKIVARSSLRRYDRSNIESQEDRPCSRLLNSRRKLLELSRESGIPFGNVSSTNVIKKLSQDVDGHSRLSSTSERSSSENDVLRKSSLLSSPAGLIISTRPAVSLHSSTASERTRSKSESYNEKSSTSSQSTTEETKNSRRKKKERTKRRETTEFDWCIDEEAMKRVLVLLEGSKSKATSKRDEDMDGSLQLVTKERDAALCERDAALRERDTVIRERDELSLDRDRIKCERDALQLEREHLLLKQEELKRELANRSSVIDHLKEHLGRAYIPVTGDWSSKLHPTFNSKSSNQTNKLDVPTASKTRPRSKSEVRTPEFFVPDQIFQRSSAYTCL